MLKKLKMWFKKLLNPDMGFLTFTSALSARHIKKDGTIINLGVICRKVVTTAFVNYLVDNLIAESTAFGDFKFHDSGTGTTAAVIGDTAMGTPTGEARTIGTQVEGASANIYKSVATHTYAGTFAITEHGLFNIATAGILMDRHVFTVINVVATDKIEFTYELTCTAGG
ncbi:hypothetical protein CVT91_00175 [Candidatus Atribacteria bacterium HGW-Atribacteria-1]|nr:MAG: hypothetical protein CVT91_00175 [Candidatus Atribacteria bacterium HGW-Atribacteria-1]